MRTGVGRAVRALALTTVALAGGCAPTPAVDGPIVRTPATRPAAATAPARLVVVSYNVHGGRDPEAVADAMVAAGLADVDVVLVQEIEDHVPAEPAPRAEVLARRLGMASVYAPARALGHGGLGNHGLAVLSRWPIVDDVVLRLPAHDLGWNSRPRIALGVTIEVGGVAVQVWNVHLDTRLAVEHRLGQLTPVLERAQALPGLAIVGGDLNTWAPVHADAVDRLAAAWGFATPTTALTATYPGGWGWPPRPPMRLDALYSRGFAVRGAGVDRALRCGRGRCSDHDPIWVELAWPRSPSS